MSGDASSWSGHRSLRFDPCDERLARAAWSRLSEPGDLAAGRLVATCGPVDALRRVVSGEGSAAVARWRVRLAAADPGRDLRQVRRAGGRLLIPGDPEWPAALNDLGAVAPFCLWVLGPARLDVACRRAVAVVGARAATHYGEHVAGELGAGLADRGVTTVSGAAYGVDAAAHRGCLAAEGTTIGVLACGVDRSYPRGNERLIGRIVERGVLVSEVPPGSAPTRWRFLERNRVIAALAGATVVVEAAWRSGALRTARKALDLGRWVAAVPGPVTSPLSAGCHALIRDGAACVTDAAEVAELTAPVGEGLVAVPERPPAEHDDLTPEQVRVLDALPLRSAVGVTSLVQAAGLEERQVLAGLGVLELRGLAVRDGGRWRRGLRPGRPRR